MASEKKLQLSYLLRFLNSEEFMGLLIVLFLAICSVVIILNPRHQLYALMLMKRGGKKYGCSWDSTWNGSTNHWIYRL